MKSEPILMEQVDQKVWNRLDEVDSLFASDKTDRARALLLTIVEEVSVSINPVHSAVLVRILRTAVTEGVDDIQSVALKVMEKCSLTDTNPALEAADILISEGNLSFAKYVLERQNAVSNTAFLEYERGRMAISEGDLEEAKNRFLMSYNSNPLFLPSYDMIIRLNPESYDWEVRKNIAQLMIKGHADRSGTSFPNSSMEALYRIYWEWYAGDRIAAKNMLDVSVGSDNSPEFRLAAGRIYMQLNDAETALMFYRQVYEEMPDIDFVKTEYAQCLLATGRAEDSLLILNEVEMKDPLNRKTMECKISALSVLGKKADLSEYVSMFISMEHADRSGYEFVAKALSESGDNQGASKFIDILISRFTNDPELFILRSSNELSAERFTSALASADEAVRLSTKSSNARYQRAKILAEMGRMKKAMRDIDAALSADSSYVPALILLKDIQMNQKEFESALKICNDVLLMDPGNSDVIKDKAYALDILGRKEESLNEYRNALRIKVDEPLFSNVLTLLVRSERYDELNDLFREFSEEYLGSSMMWRLKGNAEYAAGEYKEAMDSFAKASDISPYEPQIWHSRGMAAEQSGLLKKAEEAYDKALLMDLDNPEYWLSKAVIQEKRGNYKGAVLALNRVITETPNSVFALVRKALILVKLGRYQEGVFFVDLALKINSKDVTIHNIKKDIMKHLHDSEQVIRASDDILLVDPENRDALRDRTTAYLSLAEHQKALLSADQALRTYPLDMEFLILKKDALKGSNDPNALADVCRLILQQDPEDREIRMDLAEALADQGETEEAIMVYDQLLLEDPMDMKVTVMKAKVRSDTGEDSEAVALFQEVLENKPDDTKTLNVLADVMLEQGYDDEAKRVLDRAIKSDPMDIRSYKSKAKILMSEGNVDQAQETIQEALRKDPNDPQIWKTMGEVQEQKGDLRQALLSYDSAMKMGLDDAEMYSLRGRVQQALGMGEAAINSYSLAAIKDPKDVNSLVQVAIIQMDLGRSNAAQQNLDAALNINPSDPHALYNRAKLHMTNNERDDAIKLFNIYAGLGRNDLLERKFKEMVGLDYEERNVTGGKMFRDDLEMYAHEVLEFCYNTGYAIMDDETFVENDVPDDLREGLLKYLGNIEEYGDIDVNEREFHRMESLSKNLIINERITDVDSEPIVNLSSAYMASGTNNIEEAKRLVAYIFKVITEDIESDVYPEDVRQIAEELSSSAGDVTTFNIMEAFDCGIYVARMSKIVSGKMTDSITFHI